MRGPDEQTQHMFSDLSPEQRVPADHPLRAIRALTDAARSEPPDAPGNPTVNFHGESRRHDTHQSTTDGEAMLHKKGKGKEAQLAYLGHVLLDNRAGLVANVCVTHATGTAEREAVTILLEASVPPGSTVGADKGYDVVSFVADVRGLDVTLHVAQKARWSTGDGRTTRHPGYAVSGRKRKLVEQVFGWMKTVGGLRKLRHRGVELVDWTVTFAAAAYNLVRLRNLGRRVPERRLTQSCVRRGPTDPTRPRHRRTAVTPMMLTRSLVYRRFSAAC